MFTTQPITMTKMQPTKLNPTPCTAHPAFMSTSMNVEPMEPQGLNRLVHSPVPVVFPDEHLSYATLYPDEISIDDVIDIFNFGSLCVQIPSGPCHYPLDPLDVDLPMHLVLRVLETTVHFSRLFWVRDCIPLPQFHHMV